MNSLYNISKDILDIFDNIENQDGEITDAQEKFLEIKKDELKEKLDNYYKAILNWKQDIVACKEEINRIKVIQKRYDKRIERLSSVMIDAVINFGDEYKGKRFIELPTVKISIRNSYSTEIDEERVNYLVSVLKDYLRYLHENGVVYTGTDVDMQIVLDNINDYVKQDKGEYYKLFTLSDLKTLRVEISTDYTINELFKNGEYIIPQIINYPQRTQFKCINCKDDWKQVINEYNTDDFQYPTLARIQTNKNLSVK